MLRKLFYAPITMDDAKMNVDRHRQKNALIVKNKDVRNL